MLTIDLESGYDALGFDEESKGLFGCRMRVTEDEVKLLLEEGLIKEEHLGEVEEDGQRWAYMEPNSLIQGWKRACAIFTKVTRQLVRKWRSEGKVVCHLLDDVLVASTESEEVRERMSRKERRTIDRQTIRALS